MPMPPNGTPATQRWWNNWYLVHKTGCTEEGAFLGYLSHRSLHPYALTPEQLGIHWSAFEAWWLASTAP